MARSFIPIIPVRLTAGEQYTWGDINVRPFGVPVNATGVVLHLFCTGGAKDYGLRRNGNTDARNGSSNSGNWHTWAVVGIDGAGIFEFYNVGVAPRVVIDLIGYTVEGVNFDLAAVTAPNISPAAAAWNVVDLSTFGVPATAIGVIIEVYALISNTFGYRQNGSGDARTFNVSSEHSTFSFVVGCDANQIIELFRGAANVNFYLHGYITDGATFYLNAPDITPGVAGAWEDLLILPLTGIMPFIEVSGVGGQFGACNNVADGPADYRVNGQHSFAMPEALDRNCLGRAQAGTNFHLVGYSRFSIAEVQTNPATEIT